MKNILRRSVERANIIAYRFNKVNKTKILRHSHKMIRDPNHNQENDLREASDTTRSKIGGYGSTTTGGTGSISLDGILAEIEYTRTVNTSTHTDYEIVKVVDVKDSDIDSDEGSNCDIEDSDFVVDDEYITNFHEEEYESNFMSKDCKWESCEEVVDDEEIQELIDTYNYNGPYGIKIGVSNIFDTVLQCIFE